MVFVDPPLPTEHLHTVDLALRRDSEVRSDKPVYVLAEHVQVAKRVDDEQTDTGRYDRQQEKDASVLRPAQCDAENDAEDG
jgi:hypothetical protein